MSVFRLRGGVILEGAIGHLFEYVSMKDKGQYLWQENIAFQNLMSVVGRGNVPKACTRVWLVEGGASRNNECLHVLIEGRCVALETKGEQGDKAAMARRHGPSFPSRPFSIDDPF
jgi:hypothetical protein